MIHNVFPTQRCNLFSQVLIYKRTKNAYFGDLSGVPPPKRQKSLGVSYTPATCLLS